MPNMSNEKQYLGSQDLVNDLDEWEEGWVGLGWVGWEVAATEPNFFCHQATTSIATTAAAADVSSLPRRADLIVQ